jgi:hypothetical protein
MKHARPARQKRRAAAALRYASLDLLCSFPYDDGFHVKDPASSIGSRNWTSSVSWAEGANAALTIATVLTAQRMRRDCGNVSLGAT